MPILTMAIPRTQFMRDIRFSVDTIVEHIIKALVVKDYQNTKKWLTEAENAFLVCVNQQVKFKLKPSDFTEIYSYFEVEEYNIASHISSIMKSYNNRLTLVWVDLESLVNDLNEILSDQVSIAGDLRLSNEKYTRGLLKNSPLVKQKLKEYESYDTFFVNGDKDAKKVVASIIKLNEIGM